MCRSGDSTVVGDFDKSLTFGGAGGNVGRDADSVPIGLGRDADSTPTGLEQNQGTAFVNDRVEKFESSVGVGLGNRLDRMEVAIQNLTQCMANLVESKQAAGAPSRGQVNDCQYIKVINSFIRGTNMCRFRCGCSWRVPGPCVY